MISPDVTIYLAARYTRREELNGYKRQLEAAGCIVRARWLDGAHQLSNEGVPLGDAGEALVEDGDSPEAADLREKFALDDYDDVRAADYVVYFTQPPRTDKGRGGRHVEFGIALGQGTPVAIVGPRENIFCWLPQVQHFADWAEFAAYWRI